MGCGSSTAQAVEKPEPGPEPEPEPEPEEATVDEEELDPLEALKDKIDDVIGSEDLARVEEVLSEVNAMGAGKDSLGASLTLLLSYRTKLQAAEEPELEPEPEPEAKQLDSPAKPEAEQSTGVEADANSDSSAPTLPSDFVHPDFAGQPSPTAAAAAEAKAAAEAAVPTDFVHPDFMPK
jgi:hypothetical protein|eukprot:COSAG02_NODE_2650_length_8327_cov_247.925620_4_plen_179_part_00